MPFASPPEAPAGHPAPTPTPTPGLLRLLRLSSPTLPVGGFSYSEGLESAVEHGWVRDEGSAARWLLDQLHLGLARSDLSVMAAAIPAWAAGDLARVRWLNAWVLQTRETEELRQQSEQMGRSLMAWAQQLGAFDNGVHAALQAAELQPPSYPLACACAAAHSGAGLHDALSAHAFAWAENAVQAAIKSVPLGQSAGQRILAQLISDIPEAVATACALDDSQRQAFTPMLAILSARHETQYSRLFRS